jgi:hypothetical protein
VTSLHSPGVRNCRAIDDSGGVQEEKKVEKKKMGPRVESDHWVMVNGQYVPAAKAAAMGITP